MSTRYINNMQYNNYLNLEFDEYSEQAFGTKILSKFYENRAILFGFLTIFLSIVFTRQSFLNSFNKTLIQNLNETVVELTDSLEIEKNKVIDLEKEKDLLQTHEEDLTNQLEKLHTEFNGLQNKIKTLQERNQALCESLGDFLRFKRRKLNNDPPQTYNLREKKAVDYSGMVGADNDTSDSDYDITEDRK